jgi:hypothetical protein
MQVKIHFSSLAQQSCMVGGYTQATQSIPEQLILRGTMATIVGHSMHAAKPVLRLPGRRYDHYFFSITALLMLASVFVGFAHSYYLAGIFSAPLPSRIIHVHGAVFTCWILLLVTQTSLVAAGRVDIHRRLGIAGFFLGCSMVLLGIWAATDALTRGSGPAGRDVRFFYIVPLTDILIFAVLMFFAYRFRSRPALHKRLIFLATVALILAGIARWPWAIVHRNALVAGWLSCVFLVALIVYDLWSTRRVNRATLWGGAFLVVVQNVRFPIGQTAAWQALAAWVQTHAR